MTPKAARAQAFAVKHFARCEAHRAHAKEVHEGLEELAHHPIGAIVLDDIVEDVVGHARGGGDSLDRVELQMALEADPAVPELVDQEPEALIAEYALTTLLGPVRSQCLWDPETVWRRSVRGLINERVRQSEGCTCTLPERREH